MSEDMERRIKAAQERLAASDAKRDFLPEDGRPTIRSTSTTRSARSPTVGWRSRELHPRVRPVRGAARPVGRPPGRARLPRSRAALSGGLAREASRMVESTHRPARGPHTTRRRPMDLKVTKPIRSTWQGVPGEQTMYRVRGPLGPRVVATVWPKGNESLGAAPGEATVRCLTGDGRSVDVVVFAEAVLPVAEVPAWAEAQLEGK